GESGMEMLRSFRPDAVILDLMLPRLTGVDLMKRIRAEPNCEHLPVVVFSNTYLTNMVQEAWKAGATKCLSKANCTPKQVMNVVKTALSLNGSTQTTNGTPGKPQPSAATARAPSPAASTGTALAEAPPASAPESSTAGAQD